MYFANLRIENNILNDELDIVVDIDIVIEYVVLKKQYKRKMEKER